MATDSTNVNVRVNAMKRIMINSEKCTGCGLCEIMCSFHHRKVFSKKLASVEISESLKNGTRKISLHDRDENGHLSCDNCEGLDEPLCVTYCYTKAIVEVK